MEPSFLASRGTNIPRRLHLRSIGQRKHSWKISCRTLTEAFRSTNVFNPNHSLPLNLGQPGAVFNTTFSPDGRCLVAACEKRSIMVLDSVSHQISKSIPNAHDDCVNCVRFLDTRLFASASDDCTIALWDIRNLSQRLTILKAHSDWVKNVEYNYATKQIVSSSFDNSIKVWNVNEWSQNGEISNSDIVHIDYLMRMRLSPCLTKMIITTTNCASVIIHNLNIDKLIENPIEFDWNDLSQYHESRQLNAIEVVEDFPEGSDSFCISSAVIHPFGWAMLSRFTNHAHTTEWTALHDIQDKHFHGSECASKCIIGDSPRLQYFIEEPNVGRGFIKEQCFTPDGKVICSPFGNGVRLLSFDEDCSDLASCNWNQSPCKKFTEIKTLIGHQTPVLTTQFSPTIPLLATGCLGGKVVFSQPRF